MGSSRFGTPPLVALLGHPTTPRVWLKHALRDLPEPVLATIVPHGLSTAALQAVCAASDAGVHLLSARDGMDGRWLPAWQMLIESGTPRFVAVTDLRPADLDVVDATAIASRVLEEEILPAALPLLDDDETPVATLDLIEGTQWFPGRAPQPADPDFLSAVALECAVLAEAAEISSLPVAEAIADGQVPVSLPLETSTGVGVSWLAAHLPAHRLPAGVATVIPGDAKEMPWIAAGDYDVRPGPVDTVLGGTWVRTRILSLRSPSGDTLLDRVAPGGVAAAVWESVPDLGAHVFPAS